MSASLSSPPLALNKRPIASSLDRHVSTANDILIDRRDLSIRERCQLEALAWQHACVPESYDIAISDGHVLKTACGEGAISVLADGKFWHMAGGMLAPEPVKQKMFRWLRDLSQQHKKTIAIYNVSRDDAQRFRDEGFVVNKFGEEPILKLKNHHWSGRKFEWVRRQSNYCTREGVDVAEITDSDEQRSLAVTLQAIMTDDLAGRTFDKPLRLLEGEFNVERLCRRRLFVARDSAARVEAFLACSPINGGRSWAFETYRKRKNATRGVTAHLFRTVMDRLRDEGAEEVSLCLIPGRNVADAAVAGGDWRIREAMSFWFHRLDFAFNSKGQDHFKSRFRPEYVERYLCVAPKNSVASLWSFLKTTGATDWNLKNMLRRVCKRG